MYTPYLPSGGLFITGLLTPSTALPWKITSLLSYDLSGASSQVLQPYNDRCDGDLNLGSIPS